MPFEQVTPVHNGEQGLLSKVHPDKLAASQLSSVTVLNREANAE